MLINSTIFAMTVQPTSRVVFFLTKTSSSLNNNCLAMEEQFLKEDDVLEEIELNEGDDIGDQEIGDDDGNVEGGDDLEDHEDDGDQDIQEDLPEPEAGVCSFELHKEPVLAVAVSKSRTFAVSGGQDDIAHVFDVTSGQLKFSCIGHKDSVIGVGVNCDDTMIVSADMNGLIQVWSVSSGEKVFDYEVDDIHWTSWHPLAPFALLAGTESGSVWMFNVQDSSKMKTLQSGSTACTTGRVTNCGNKLMSGYEDGSLRFWDLKTSKIVHTNKDNLSHQSSVTCIDLKEDDSMAASGSTDGTVKMTNVSSGKIVATLVCGRIPEAEEEEDSVESVKFCNSLPLLASATVKGIIEVWEICNYTRRCYVIHDLGVSTVQWDPLETFKLFSAGLDGCVNHWDARSGELLSRRYSHRDHILDMKVVTNESNERLIVTASEDSTCKVFRCE